MIYGQNENHSHHNDLSRAALLMHGDLLYEESHNVIVYTCWHCGGQHRAYMDGPNIRRLADPQPGVPREEMNAWAPKVPDVFASILESASVKAFLEEG